MTTLNSAMYSNYFSQNTIEFMPFSIRSWKKLLNNTGLLGYGIIFIVLGSKVFVNRTTGDVVSGSLDISMAHRLIFLILSINIVLINLKKIKLPKSRGLIFFLIYVIVAIFSSIWSQTTIVTFAKSIEILVALLLILIASNEENNNSVLISLLQIIFYLIFLQITFVLFGFLGGIEGFSEKGSGGLADIIGRRCSGPFISANSVGYFSSILLSMFIGLLLHKRYLSFTNLLFVFVMVLSLLLSTSRTSLGITFLVLLYFFYHRKKIIFFSIVLPSTIAIIYKTHDLILSLIQGNSAHINLVTLSGRTFLWEQAIEFGMNHLFIGSGFGIGSRLMFLEVEHKGFGNTISTVHNGFLEVFLGVGLLGFIPWILSFISLLFICIKHFSTNYYRFSYILIVWPTLLFTTIMSIGIGGALNEFYIIMAIILAMHENQLFFLHR